MTLSADKRHPWHVSDLGENVFSFSYWLWCELWAYYIWLSLCWSMFLQLPTLWRVFVINGCWILKNLYCICWDDYMTSIFHFVIVVYHTDLQILNYSCVPGVNSTWSWYMILLIYFWMKFAILLMRLASVMLVYSFFFFVLFLSSDARFVEWVWELSFL